MILYLLHGINANLFTVKSKSINSCSSKLHASVQKTVSKSVIQFSTTIHVQASSSPIRKEQRKYEKNGRSLAFWLVHGRRSNSSSRCRRSPLAALPRPAAYRHPSHQQKQSLLPLTAARSPPLAAAPRSNGPELWVPPALPLPLVGPSSRAAAAAANTRELGEEQDYERMARVTASACIDSAWACA